jgi:uncharacterized protein YggT (Ycf19 family)
MRTDIIEPSFRSHRIRERLTRGLIASRVARVVDYLFGILYALLAVRFVLELLRARYDSGFFGFIRDATDPFFAPFRGIVPNGTVDGLRIVWPLVVALVAYMVLHAIVRGLLRLLARA